MNEVEEEEECTASEEGWEPSPGIMTKDDGSG